MVTVLFQFESVVFIWKMNQAIEIDTKSWSAEMFCLKKCVCAKSLRLLRKPYFAKNQLIGKNRSFRFIFIPQLYRF